MDTCDTTYVWSSLSALLGMFLLWYKLSNV